MRMLVECDLVPKETVFASTHIIINKNGGKF